MNRPSFIYLLLAGLILFVGCRQNLYDVPYPSDITKTHREAIGDYINQRIYQDADTYPLLEKTIDNESAFNLIQTLYDQVTNTMRLDNKSPNSNRWRAGRQWRIHIINLENQMAFVIPGGDLYLSKGLLRAIG